LPKPSSRNPLSSDRKYFRSRWCREKSRNVKMQDLALAWVPSLSTNLTLIRLHLKPFFGSMLLTEFTRESVRRYIDTRRAETIIRCGKVSKKKFIVAQ
jgi:hypothetical protein